MIKKLLPILLFSFFCVVEISTAQTNNNGFFETYIIVNNTYFDLGASTGNPNFEGNDLGTFSCSQGPKLNGFEAKLFKCGSCDVTDVLLFYRIYKEGTTPGGFSSLAQNSASNIGGAGSGCQNQQWQHTGGDINLYSSLANGRYVFEVYTFGKGNNCFNSEFYDTNFNGNNNFKAYFTVNTPISIGTATASNTVICYGSNASISVNTQSGGEKYYWEKQNLDNSWAEVSSGTLTSTIPNLALSNITAAASYRCRITNCTDKNEAISNVVVVSPQRPSITTQPVDAIDCYDNTANFYVGASPANTGNSLTYEWYRKLPSGSFVVMSTPPTGITFVSPNYLRVSNIGAPISSPNNPNGTQFYCKITEQNTGCSISSNEATLQINKFSPNIVVTSPVCEGGSISFTANIEFGASRLQSYQWYKNNISTGSVSGANANTFSTVINTTADNRWGVQGTFSSNFTNSSGVTTNLTCVTSQLSTITVRARPVAPTAPSVQRCGDGSVSLSATSTLGTNEIFRWYADNTTSTILSFGTPSTFNISSLAVGSYTYYVSVYNTSTTCESVRTPITITVHPLPTITLSTVEDVCPQATSFNLPYTSTTNSPNQYSISASSPSLSGFTAVSNATLGSSPISVNIPANSTSGTYQFSISVKNTTTTCSSISQNFSLIIKSPTTVTKNPSNQIVCEGNTVNLNAEGSGAGVVSYQWRKNGTNISGETSAVYTITSIALTQAGNYDCLVIADCGIATTTAATISVNPKSKFVTQPLAQTVCREDAATFSVSATGTGTLEYRWKKGTTILNDGTNVLGSTTSTLLLTNLQLADAGTYICEVKGTCDDDFVPSNTVLLTVNDLPQAPTVDTPIYYCKDASAIELSASAASGNTLLWYGMNSSGGVSSNSAPIPLTNVVGTINYYVTQKDLKGCESPRASISVITLSPISGSISGLDKLCSTGNINNSTLLTISATGGTGTYTYQWQNIAGNISGATGNTYEVTNIFQTTTTDTYKATIISGACTATTNNTITVTKTGWLDISITGNTPNICGSGSKELSIVNPVAGATYKWFSDVSSNSALSTGSSYTTPNLTSTATYYAAREGLLATGLTCQSNRASATINITSIPNAPTITSSDNDNTICSGSTVTLTANGCGGTITWSNGSNLSTITVSGSGTYNATCTVNGCVSSASATQTINVNTIPTAPTITSSDSDNTICTGESISLTASGCSGIIAWSNGSSSSIISVSSSGTYNATCTLNGCTSNASLTQSIIVHTFPSFSVNPIDRTQCKSQSISLSGSTSSSATFQWEYRKTPLDAFVDVGTIFTGTSHSLSVTAGSTTYPNGSEFRLKATSNGCLATSSSAYLKVNSVDGDIADQTKCARASTNLDASVLSLQGTITGYQWESSTVSGSGYNPVSGSQYSGTTTQNLQINPLSSSDALYYKIRVYFTNSTSGGSCSILSNSVKLNVTTISAPTINGASTVCQGQSTTLTASGCSGVVVWNTSASGSTLSVSNAGTYSATCTQNNCTSVESNILTLTILPKPTAPTIVSSDDDNTVCSGTSISLTANGCNGIITWNNGSTGSGITVTTSGTFNATCTENGCVSDSSPLQTITINPIPTAPIISGNLSLCDGQTTNLTASGCNGTVVWNTAFSGSIINISAAGTYSATCTLNNCTSVASATQTVVLNAKPTKPSIIGLSTICSGSSTTLSATGCNGQVNWSNTSIGATINVSSAGTYSAICTENGCFSDTSDVFTLSISPLPSISLNSVSDICFNSTSFSLGYIETTNLPNKYSITSSMPDFVGIIDADLGSSPININIPSNKNGLHNFSIKVKNSVTGCESITQNFSVNVLNTLSAGSIDASPSGNFCSGYNAGAIGSVSLATGGKTTYSYQWESSTNGIDYSSISGQTTTTYDPPGLTTTTYYRRKVTDACGEIKYSNVHQKTIVSDPTATVSATTPTTICSGGTVTFSATTSGGTGTCSIKWQSSNSSSASGTWTDEQIGGTSFTTTALSVVGKKYFRIFYDCDGTSCNQFVGGAIEITINPLPTTPVISGGGTICSGTTTTLSSTGCNGTLAWTTGASTSTITVSNAGTYSATCTNSCGISLKSNEITVNVTSINSPTLSGGGTICTGQSLSLTANGCNGTVRWSNGSTGSSITVSPTTTSQYTATCSELGCTSPASSSITVEVSQSLDFIVGALSSLCNTATNFELPYTITIGIADKYSLVSTMPNFTAKNNLPIETPPINITIPSGKTGTHTFTLTLINSSTGCSKNVDFTVTVLSEMSAGSIDASPSGNFCSGYNAGTIGSVSLATGGKTTYSYQWESSTNGIDYSSISGQTATTYDPPGLTTTTYYRRKVTDACGEIKYSNVHQKTIVSDPTATISATTPTTICSGGTVTFSATTSGGTGTCSIKWQSSNSSSASGTWTDEQVGGTSFTTTALSVVGKKYFRIFYDCDGTSCNQFVGGAIEITINPLPTTPVISGGGTICSGTTTTLSSTGCNGTLAWTTGASTPTITVSNAGTYSATCTNSCGTSIKSNEITVNVTSINPPILSGGGTICTGQSLSLSASGCNGTVRWSNGSTGSIITVSPTNTTQYTATCTSNSCESLPSEAVSVVINQSLDFSIGSINALCNSSTNFQLPYSIQVGTANLYSISSQMPDFVAVNDASLGVSPLSINIPSGKAGTYNFTLTLKNGTSGCSKSLNFTITILKSLVAGGIETSSSTINCEGYNAGLITSLSEATEGKTPYIYQWESSINNADFSIISGQNSSTYDPPSLTQTTYYRRKVTDACGESKYSNVHQINITPDPQINITDISDRIICSGGSVSLSAISSGGSGTCSINWQILDNITNAWTTVSSGTPSYSFLASNTTTTPLINYLRAIYTCSGTGSGSCNQGISSTVKVTTNSIPVAPTVSPSSIVVCSNQSASLVASGCNGTVVWSNSQTGSTISVNIAGSYSVKCILNSCESPNSNISSVSISESSALAPPIVSGTAIICQGGTVSLTASGCANTLLWSNGSSTSVINVSPLTTTSYSATCSDGICTSTASNIATITVNPLPNISIQPQNQSDCKGNSVSFSVSASVSSGSLSYQWQKKKSDESSFIDISGANGSSLTVSNVGSTDNPHLTEYRCVLTGTGGCSVITNSANLFVNSVSGTLSNKSVCEASSTSIDLTSLSIVGSPTYQWQIKIGSTWTDVVEGSGITGSKTAILNIASTSSSIAGDYRNKMVFNLVPSGTCTINSDDMILSVTAIPTPPSVVSPVSYCQNSVATALSATASSGNSLVWYSSSTGGTGSTTSIIPSTSSVGTFSYYVAQKTTNNCESSRNEIQVIIKNGIVSPINTTPTTVSPPNTLIFSAQTTVTNAGLLWYNSATGGIGTSIAPSYTASGTYSHWVSQTDLSTGCESPRLQIISEILNPFRIITQPINQADCKGNSVNMLVVVAGSSSSFSYQWQRKKPTDSDFINLISDGNGITGFNTANLRVSSVGNSNNPHLSEYRCLISDGVQTIISNQAILYVNALMGSLPNTSVCVGGNTSLNLNNFIISGDIVSYQWQTRPSTSGDWTNLTDANGISGSNSKELKFTNVQFSQGVYYRCIVKFNTIGIICEESSDPARLDVGSFAGAPSVSEVFYCQYANASKLKINNPNSDYDEVWYTQPTGGTGTTTTPTPSTAIAGEVNYYVSVRSEYGCESPRSLLKVVIAPQPTLPINTTPNIVEEGNNLVFSAKGENLRWYTSPTGTAFTTTAPILTAVGSYTRYVAQVSQFSCIGPRLPISAAIIPSLKFTRQPISQADCDGNSVTFSVTSAGYGTVKYQWQRLLPNETIFTNISGANSNSLKIDDVGNANAPNQTKYRCVVTDNDGTAISSEATLTVNSVSGAFKKINLCEGSKTTINLSDLNITGKIVSYQWQKKSGNSYTDIPNAIDSVLVVNEKGTYRCKIAFELTPRTTCSRNTADVVVESQASPSSPTVKDAIVCQNTPNYLIESQIKATNNVIWYANAEAKSGSTTLPKIDVSSVSKTTFWVSQLGTNGCESARVSFTTEIVDVPSKPLVNTEQIYCRNETALPLVATSTAPNQIFWYTQSNGGIGLSSITPNTQSDGSTSYFVSAKNKFGCESQRSEIKVNVKPCIAPVEALQNCLEVARDSISGNKWFDIFDKQGKMYASINPNGQNLGKVTISIKYYDGEAKTINGTQLLPRYLDFQSSLLKDFAKPVSLKIYHKNSEFEEYKKKTNLPNLTINDLNIVHYDGIREDCGFENNDNFKEGESYVIYKNVVGNQLTTEFFSLDYEVNSFSENGATANDFAELSYDFVKADEKSVKGTWKTSLEVKALKFWIQRSADNSKWTTLKEISANGSPTSYELIDYQPLGGKSYYRIIYIDKDGTKKIYDSKSVEFNDPICQVFPNPSDNRKNINLYLRNINEKEIKLIDILGQNVGIEITKSELGIFQLQPTFQLSGGSYFVVVIDENGRRCLQKVIINP